MIPKLFLAALAVALSWETVHAQQREREDAKPGTTCSMMQTSCVGGGLKKHVNDEAIEKCQRSHAFCMKTGIYRFPKRDVHGLQKH